MSAGHLLPYSVNSWLKLEVIVGFHALFTGSLFLQISKFITFIMSKNVILKVINRLINILSNMASFLKVTLLHHTMYRYCQFSLHINSFWEECRLRVFENWILSTKKEWGVEKAPRWGTSKFVLFTYYSQGE